MVNENEKKFRKVFIEETLGTRKYFSYRSDLMLSKILISLAAFIVIYMITSDFSLSLLILIQVFAILTLINKLNINRKEKEGKEILFKKLKMEFFKKKLNDMDFEHFEELIQYFALKEGYTDYAKVGKHMFSANREGETFCIKVFKLYELSEVEKIDIRSFITFMNQNKIKKGILCTCNDLSEDAKQFIEKVNEEKLIKVINFEKLCDMAVKYDLLPEDSSFYNKISSLKPKIDPKTIKNNTLNNKKIVIYIIGATFFYFISKYMPYNITAIYIFYYFIILTIGSIVYNVLIKRLNKSNSNTTE